MGSQSGISQPQAFSIRRRRPLRGQWAEGSNKVSGGWMVSDMAGVAGVSDDAVAIDNERPWHLEGVTNRFLDAVALSGGLDAVDYWGRP